MGLVKLQEEQLEMVSAIDTTAYLELEVLNDETGTLSGAQTLSFKPGSTSMVTDVCKGVDCSTISNTVYTMYCRHQYGWYSVN